MFGNEETNKMKTAVMPDSSLDSRARAAEDEQSVRGRGTPMEHQDVSRRTLLKGGAALAGLTVLRVAGPEQALGDPGAEDDLVGGDDPPDPAPALETSGSEVLPWLDQPPPFPLPELGGNQLKWEELESWLIPTDKFHFVTHFGIPDGLD
jgi:hypothetical protein